MGENLPQGSGWKFQKYLSCHHLGRGWKVAKNVLYYVYIYIWVFPKLGVPQDGWFIIENPVKMDDLGYHYFSETPIYSLAFLEMIPLKLKFTTEMMSSPTILPMTISGGTHYPESYVCSKSPLQTYPSIRSIYDKSCMHILCYWFASKINQNKICLPLHAWSERYQVPGLPKRPPFMQLGRSRFVVSTAFLGLFWCTVGGWRWSNSLVDGGHSDLNPPRRQASWEGGEVSFPRYKLRFN